MVQSQDEQYLKILSIFHYVVGGIAGLYACFPIIHLVAGIGIVILSFTEKSAEGVPPLFIGLFFIIFAGSFILIGWALAICIILAGIFISKRTNYMFCLVIAGIQCVFTPFGTVLGVFTIINLIHPSVKESFDIQLSNSAPKVT